MGDPTRPTEPIGPGGEPRPVVRERDYAVAPDGALLEEVRRIRFWTYFGAVVGVAASVLAVIALVVALGNDDNENGDRGSSVAISSLRSDVSDLRSDVSRTNSNVNDVSDRVDSLSNRVKKLEQSAGDQSKLQDDISALQQDLSDLSDRVDQVERAQEEAASGGP
jgi:septal ring factor EnvC (AmiA/AmiB activator)